MKVDSVCAGLSGNVDWCSCFPFIVAEGDEVDGQLKIIHDCTDLVVCEWVLDLVETLFCEEAVVPEWALRIFGAWVKGRQDRITKASIVSVGDIDDCPLLR